MPVLLKNNVSSTLLSDISASDVELTVASGEGADFPTVGVNEFFFITVTNPGGAQEIMKVVSRSSDTMAIVRAQDGTSARAFTANALVQMLVNAASVSQFVAEFDRSAEDVSYDNTASGLTATNTKAAIDELNTLRTAANTSYSNTTSGLTATDVQAAVDELRSSDNITYDGTVSGLAATDVKAAIDELDTLRTGGDVSYNNTASGLTATTIQAAIDELDTLRTAGDTTYDNTASGLVATNVKAAIDELAADTVATADLDDDSVTYAKMQNVVTANRLLGSTSADGIVSEVQVQTDMIADDAVTLAKMADGTSGDILYYAGTGAPTRLAKGTDGQILELQAGFPSWQTPASAGTSGSGANDRVAVWSGSTSLDSSSIFTWDGSALAVGDASATVTADIMGVATVVSNRQLIDFGGATLTPTVGLAIRSSFTSTGGNASAIEFYSREALGRSTIVGTIVTTQTATSYTSPSDYRLKENVVDLTGAIPRLKQLRPKRFNFIKTPDFTVDGFLAHEAQEVVPQAVFGEKDGESMQNMDSVHLVPLLTAALQEAITKIESLEARVAQLEGM